MEGTWNGRLQCLNLGAQCLHPQILLFGHCLTKEALAASLWPLKMPLMENDLQEKGLWFKRTINYLLDSNQRLIYTTEGFGPCTCLKSVCNISDLMLVISWPCHPLYGLCCSQSAQALWGIWGSFFRSPGRELKYHSSGFSCLMSDGFCTPVQTNYCNVPSEPQLYYQNVLEKKIRAVQHVLKMGSCCNVSVM